jgi:hypothetical protein
MDSGNRPGEGLLYVQDSLRWGNTSAIKSLTARRQNETQMTNECRVGRRVALRQAA